MPNSIVNEEKYTAVAWKEIVKVAATLPAQGKVAAEKSLSTGSYSFQRRDRETQTGPVEDQ